MLYINFLKEHGASRCLSSFNKETSSLWIFRFICVIIVTKVNFNALFFNSFFNIISKLFFFKNFVCKDKASNVSWESSVNHVLFEDIEYFICHLLASCIY